MRTNFNGRQRHIFWGCFLGYLAAYVARLNIVKAEFPVRTASAGTRREPVAKLMESVQASHARQNAPCSRRRRHSMAQMGKTSFTMQPLCVFALPTEIDARFP